MRTAGAEPLEPYPGATVNWRCRCMKCGRTITPRVSKVLVRGVCGYCAGKLVDPASAVERMRSAGLEPLVPYPGNKQPWPCRCLTCGAEVKPRYNNVEQGAAGCNRCSGHVVDEENAATVLRQHGFEPLEEYPGCQIPWRCVCQRCGRETTKRWNDVKSGVPGCKYCANRAVTAPEAVTSMRAVGLEPLDPYPGSARAWRCRCLTCDALVSPSLSTVRSAGSSCRVCAARQRGMSGRRGTDECAELMRAVGLEPLESYPGSNVRWKSRHTVCGRITNPTFHSVMSINGPRCPHCAVSGFKPALPAEVYLITDQVRDVHKVGIGGLQSNRVELWRKKGWSLYRARRFTVGADAYIVEQRTLRWLRHDRGLPPYLALDDGWSETVAGDAIELPEIWAQIEAIARSVLVPAPPPSDRDVSGGALAF